MKKNSCFKAFACAAVVIAGFHHVAVTAAYLTPPSPWKNKAASYMSAYINPLFTQNWHLFSPNPGVNHFQIQVACGAAEAEKFVEPFGALRTSFLQTRFLGLTKPLHILQSLTQTGWEKGVLETASCQAGNKQGKTCKIALEKTPFIQLASVARNTCGVEDWKKIVLRRFSPRPYSERENSNWRSKASTVEIAHDGKVYAAYFGGEK